EILERIRDVIRDTSTPSWFGSVPSNFGDASAGTIKADEWRSLITVYVPIALISRLIGTLQRLPSNHKTGGFLESTMLQSYLKGAKLCAWLSRPNCPPAIRECKILLDRAYRS
ncbi:hypothetical protein HYDPIDRAFT_50134, partial [Hydnomerulius pinastri MD-312]